MDIHDPSDDLPDWAWEIIERHDLALRADSPLAAATVLLTDAAFDLTELSRTTFGEQALSPTMRAKAEACRAALADALALAKLCPTHPTPGVVREREDGTLEWSDERVSIPPSELGAREDHRASAAPRRRPLATETTDVVHLETFEDAVMRAIAAARSAGVRSQADPHAIMPVRVRLCAIALEQLAEAFDPSDIAVALHAIMSLHYRDGGSPRSQLARVLGRIEAARDPHDEAEDGPPLAPDDAPRWRSHDGDEGLFDPENGDDA